MTNFRRIFAIVIASVVLVLIVQAQPNKRNREQQVAAIFERLERNSSKFRHSLNAALIQTRIDQTRPQNDINTFEPSLVRAIRQLKDQFTSRVAVTADFENVLQKATDVNGFMASNRLNTQVQKDWASIRNDLNALAGVYGITWQWKRSAPPGDLNRSLSMSNAELDQLIQRIEIGEDAFRVSLTEAFWHSRYDQTTSEAKINDAVRYLGHDTNQLRIQFDDKKVIVGLVERVLARATPIDAYVRNTRLTDRAQSDWSTLRNDLNRLAGAYELTVSWPIATTSLKDTPKP